MTTTVETKFRCFKIVLSLTISHRSSMKLRMTYL